MSDRVVNFIRGEIESLQIRKRMGATSLMIQCPYHDDNTPSGGINVDPTKSVPLGWFRCMGCAKSKPWNELAAKLGLRQLKKRSETEVTAADYFDPRNVTKTLLDEEGEDEDQEFDLKRLSFFDFPAEVTEWRGFTSKFLTKVGCRYAFYDDERTGGEFMIWMPCVVRGEQVGYVKAFLEKEDGRPSYINAPGPWSRKSGLLFFDYAVKLAKRKQYNALVLVEGPRDALRLLKYGIPAVCILGTQSWSDDKRLLLEEVVENTLIFMDGDKAGRKATKMILKSVKGFLGVKYINMWKYGRKWDPGNCPKRILRKVRDALETSFKDT